MKKRANNKLKENISQQCCYVQRVTVGVCVVDRMSVGTSKAMHGLTPPSMDEPYVSLSH